MGGKHSKKQPKHIRLIERGLCGDDYWCCPDAVLHGNNMVANKEDDPKMSCRAKSLFLLFFPLRWGDNSQLAEITKRKFDPQTLAAAVLAVAGVGFLELAGSQQFVIGTGIHRVSWRFGGPQVLSKRNIILNTKQGGSSLKTSTDMQTNLDHP